MVPLLEDELRCALRAVEHLLGQPVDGVGRQREENRVTFETLVDQLHVVVVLFPRHLRQVLVDLLVYVVASSDFLVSFLLVPLLVVQILVIATRFRALSMYLLMSSVNSVLCFSCSFCWPTKS